MMRTDGHAHATERSGMGSVASESAHPTVESRIPARLDRLPFRRWHVLVIEALGITGIATTTRRSTIGRTSDAVVRGVPCPVLAVRGDPAERVGDPTEGGR